MKRIALLAIGCLLSTAASAQPIPLAIGSGRPTPRPAAPMPDETPGNVDALAEEIVPAGLIPTMNGGFGRFRWGMSIEQARAVEKRLSPFPGAEPVATEAEALDRFTEIERQAAKARGRKALRAWKKAPRSQPRLAAYRHWIDLGGLTGRLELRFADDRLYAGIVRVMYQAKQKPAARRILDGLVQKYGVPLDPPVGVAPPEERPRLDFAVPGGRLQVLRSRVTPRRRRGMLRLHYRADGLSAGVDRYIEGLRGRLAALDMPPAPPPEPPKPPPPADPLLDNL